MIKSVGRSFVANAIPLLFLARFAHLQGHGFKRRWDAVALTAAEKRGDRRRRLVDLRTTASPAI